MNTINQNDIGSINLKNRLLRRTSFGLSNTKLDQLYDLSYEEIVEKLLTPESNNIHQSLYY